MEIFTSVSDLLENHQSTNAVKDEIINLKYDLKKQMDSGLMPDEMEKIKCGYDAVLAAERILEKF